MERFFESHRERHRDVVLGIPVDTPAGRPCRSTGAALLRGLMWPVEFRVIAEQHALGREEHEADQQGGHVEHVGEVPASLSTPATLRRKWTPLSSPQRTTTR